MQKAPLAEFVVSAVSESDFPREGLLEVVFAGRSNVGKSSLLNRLAQNKGLAYTSSTPGKTQSINFYRVDRSFFFVDLPGYGYAKAAKAAMRQWKILVERYLKGRPTIVLVLQLVDARMAPRQLDLELAQWLDHFEIPRLVIATKADKLRFSRRLAQQRLIADALGSRVIMSSAVTGTGCRETWVNVSETVRARRPRAESTVN